METLSVFLDAIYDSIRFSSNDDWEWESYENRCLKMQVIDNRFLVQSIGLTNEAN